MNPSKFSFCASNQRSGIVEIPSGLGNQMSQYTLGEYFKNRYGLRIFHDTNFFNSKFVAQVAPRSLRLGYFTGCQLSSYEPPYYYSKKTSKRLIRQTFGIKCFRELTGDQKSTVTNSIPSGDISFPRNWSTYEIVGRVDRLNKVFDLDDEAYSQAYQTLKTDLKTRPH